MLPSVKIYFVQILSVFVLYSLLKSTQAGLKEGECEVCIKVLNKFINDHLAKEDAGDPEKIEKSFLKFCKNLHNSKEERFCYYVGGSSISATNILTAITRPISYHKPVEKICEELKKKDVQICDLKYEKQIDLATADFKKLKVKDLKRILENWGETSACKGCAEKSDFVRVIKELMPKHDPDAARKRDEL